MILRKIKLLVFIPIWVILISITLHFGSYYTKRFFFWCNSHAKGVWNLGYIMHNSFANLEISFQSVPSKIWFLENRKLSAIARVRYYLNFHQKMLIKARLQSPFKYSYLTLMFYSQKSDSKTNLLHEKLSKWSIMNKLYHLKNFFKIITSLMFIITSLMFIIFTHLYWNVQNQL